MITLMSAQIEYRITCELLETCSAGLNKDKAPGFDGLTAEQ